MLSKDNPVAWALLLFVLGTSFSEAVNPYRVGLFSQGQLDGWKEHSFSGTTEYQLVEMDGRKVLRAVSKASASGYYFQTRIDLDKTPYLNWSWKIHSALEGLRETTRAGDDFAARIYVVIDGGLFFWNTRALTYVWSGSQSVGSSWPNAHIENTVLLAIESGATHVGQWREYKRDLRQDLENYLGVTQRYIDAVAIMTDTDNSRTSAQAYYGDIWFSEQ